jgi:hypothetical protein
MALGGQQTGPGVVVVADVVPVPVTHGGGRQPAGSAIMGQGLPAAHGGGHGAGHPAG